MSRIAVFVGLDYHQDSVQVCVLDKKGKILRNRRCANDWRAIVEKARGCGRVRSVALESCNGAAELAEELVQGAGWSVQLAHAGYVHRMKQTPDKSDFTDAHVLADLVRVGYLPRVWLPPPAVRELRRQVHYRQQKVAARRAVKQQMGALLRNNRARSPRGVSRWTRAWMRWLGGAPVSEESRCILEDQLEHVRWLNGAIAKVEARLTFLTKEDPIVTKLLSFAGIGPVTAWTLRAEVGRFERFPSGKHLSRFIGVSPKNASTGGRQGDAGLVKTGNPQLRATLIQVAHQLIRRQPRWRKLALRLHKAGKPNCVIVAAVANRWVRWLHHQMQPERVAA